MEVDVRGLGVLFRSLRFVVGRSADPDTVVGDYTHREWYQVLGQRRGG